MLARSAELCVAEVGSMELCIAKCKASRKKQFMSRLGFDPGALGAQDLMPAPLEPLARAP
jgi:hypothetical protein